MAAYRAAAYSENTKKTYRAQLNAYYKFCEEMQICPVPVNDSIVTEYAAYLARRLRPSSVKQYLNVIRLVHLECNFDNPCKDSWLVKTTLAGIDRTLGNPVHRKEPVTPTLLLLIRRHLLNDVFDIMFWAASMVLFFGTFRKSNLMPDKCASFAKDKQFIRSRL